jgi:hypothetical protein
MIPSSIAALPWSAVRAAAVRCRGESCPASTSLAVVVAFRGYRALPLREVAS